jgi:hypothetical protein
VRRKRLLIMNSLPIFDQPHRLARFPLGLQVILRAQDSPQLPSRSREIDVSLPCLSPRLALASPCSRLALLSPRLALLAASESPALALPSFFLRAQDSPQAARELAVSLSCLSPRLALALPLLSPCPPRRLTSLSPCPQAPCCPSPCATRSSTNQSTCNR